MSNALVLHGDHVRIVASSYRFKQQLSEFGLFSGEVRERHNGNNRNHKRNRKRTHNSNKGVK